MKAVKVRRDLLWIFTPLNLIISFTLIWFFAKETLKAAPITWIGLIIAIILFFTPLAKRRLIGASAEKPRYAFWPWLLRIFWLQFCISAIYLGIAQIVGLSLPTLSIPHPALFIHTAPYFLFHLGLFPWTFIALVAVGMGYYSYRKDQDAYINTVLFSLFKSGPQQSIGLIVNSLAKQATITVFATSVAFMILLMADLVIPRSIPIPSGFHAGVMVFLLVLLGFVFTAVGRRYLSRFLSRKISPVTSFLLLSLAITGLIILMSLLFQTTKPVSIPTDKLPTILIALKKKDWMSMWNLFSITWWFAWTPLLGAHVAKLSRGRSIRSILIATLILPILLAIYFIIVHHHEVLLFRHHRILIEIIAVIGFVGLLALICKRENMPMLILSYLPKRDKLKHRDHYLYFRKFTKLLTIVFYLFLPAGFVALTVVTFILNFAICIVLLIASIAVIIGKKIHYEL